jgi:hypothetical protein
MIINNFIVLYLNQCFYLNQKLNSLPDHFKQAKAKAQANNTPADFEILLAFSTVNSLPIYNFLHYFFDLK